jgi:hypothetical protein
MDRIPDHLKLYRSREDEYDDYARRYPGLVQFLGSCFHQDWRDEYGADWRSAVRVLAAASTREEMQVVRRELDLLLTEIEHKKHGDAEVIRVLYHGFGCEYFPEGTSGSQWISALAQATRESPQPPPPPSAPNPASVRTTQSSVARSSHASPARSEERSGGRDTSVLLLLAQVLALIVGFGIGLLLLL